MANSRLYEDLKKNIRGQVEGSGVAVGVGIAQCEVVGLGGARLIGELGEPSRWPASRRRSARGPLRMDVSDLGADDVDLTGLVADVETENERSRTPRTFHLQPEMTASG
jgi:hypothetical protein